MSFAAAYWLWHPDAQNVPRQDMKVRKALTLAINRQEILDTIFMERGALKPTNYSMPSWCIGWDASKFPPVPPYDPEQVKRLLAESGYPDGFKQTMYDVPWVGAPEIPLINQSVASYWQKIGLEVDFIPMEQGVWLKMNRAGDCVYGSYCLSSIGNRGYNGGILPDYSTKDPGSYALNDGLDKLAEEAINATTLEEFIERVQKWERYMQENYVTIPIAEGRLAP